LAGSSVNNLPTSFFGVGQAVGLRVLGKARDYYSAYGTELLNSVTSAGQSINSLFSDPVGTISTAAQGHWDMMTNPMAFMQSFNQQVGKFNPAVGMAQDLVDAAMSDDFVSSMGGSGGRRMGDYVIEAAGVGLGGIAARFAKWGMRGLKQVGLGFRSVDDVLANPSVLEGKSYTQVRSALNNSDGWVHDVMRRTRSADKGWVFRQVNANGAFTGRMIQYHPGSRRHFGGRPYWKVSDGTDIFKFLAK